MNKYQITADPSALVLKHENGRVLNTGKSINKGSIIIGHPVSLNLMGHQRGFIRIGRGLYIRPTDAVVAMPYSKAEGASAGGGIIKPAVEPVKKEGVSAKSIMDSAKGVVTDKTVLTVAGVGLGTGLALSWLVGARGSQMAGITATTTLLGGVMGYGFSGERYFGADGKGKPKTLKQNVCGDKDGTACEVVIDKDLTIKGNWGVNARGKCACISGGGSASFNGKGKPSALKQNVCGDKDGTACEVKFEDGTVAVKGTWGVNARGKCACIGGSSAQRRK